MADERIRPESRRPLLGVPTTGFMCGLEVVWVEVALEILGGRGRRLGCMQVCGRRELEGGLADGDLSFAGTVWRRDGDGVTGGCSEGEVLRRRRRDIRGSRSKCVFAKQKTVEYNRDTYVLVCFDETCSVSGERTPLGAL